LCKRSVNATEAEVNCWWAATWSQIEKAMERERESETWAHVIVVVVHAPNFSG